ncbi:MAG: cobalamin-dependent protein [Bacteroidales bacterium]|nr:cobalamin-dependent protein [Bacteroidales bacterium]
MKVLLINPPRSPENNILKFAPAAAKQFIHKKLIGPPLGLLTIAAVVNDHDVVVFDIKGEYDLNPAAPPLRKLVKELVERYRPDVVGVTVITSEFNDSVTICQVAKEVNPTIMTVAGGLHATLLPFDFSDPSVDVVIPGQCPQIFRELMRAKEAGIPLESVAGILIRQQGVLTRTRGKPSSWDATGGDFLAIDRGHLAKWISTYKVGNSPDPSTYVFTSLGCPYKCTFCSIWTQFRGKFHQRTVESLIKELQSIPEYPVVRFADANTVVDMQFMNHLFDRIVDERIEKILVMDIRADVAANHPEIIAKMAKGGLKVVICGFESFRDEELLRYKKESPAADNQKAIEVFHEHGIMVRGNYVIPFDYDEDDFRALADYSSANPVVYAGYTILSPMPGTVYYQQIKDKIIDHNYNKYNFFNAVTRTTLPYEEFHERVGGLWLIKKGTDVI